MYVAVWANFDAFSWTAQSSYKATTVDTDLQKVGPQLFGHVVQGTEPWGVTPAVTQTSTGTHKEGQSLGFCEDL